MRVAIASDHRGFRLKKRLVQFLESEGHLCEDCGTKAEAPCDYPDYAKHVAEQVSSGKVDRGVLICGNGMGMAIVANKFSGVRAATCHDEVMAEISRRHNDVNVLCLAGDLIGDRPIDHVIRLWLETPFDGGRHCSRIEKISEFESRA